MLYLFTHLYYCRLTHAYFQVLIKNFFSCMKVKKTLVKYDANEVVYFSYMFCLYFYTGLMSRVSTFFVHTCISFLICFTYYKLYFEQKYIWLKHILTSQWLNIKTELSNNYSVWTKPLIICRISHTKIASST